MVVGVDFDNTLVSYDQLFWQLARERQLIPEGLLRSKTEVRDYLHRAGAGDTWTELQATAYGPRMVDAVAFEGAREFLTACRLKAIPVFIISHRTAAPYRRPGATAASPGSYALHDAAQQWLRANGFHDPEGIGLPVASVHFEASQRAKLARIATRRCTHFVDDLPEFLGDTAFRQGVRRILFDPASRYGDDCQFQRAASWSELSRLLMPA